MSQVLKTRVLMVFLTLFIFRIACANAAIIVSENFEDKSLGSLAGQGGGVGWGNNWSAFTGVNVSQDGLNYSNGSVSVFGGSRKLAMNSPADGRALSRQFSQGTSGTTYMSMLFQAVTPPDST